MSSPVEFYGSEYAHSESRSRGRTRRPMARAWAEAYRNKASMITNPTELFDGAGRDGPWPRDRGP